VLYSLHFIGRGYEVSGEVGKFIMPLVQDYQELGGNPDGWLDPTIIKVTGVNPRIADRLRLKVNGVDHALVTFADTPAEYYIANTANPSWPRIFVNRSNSIPGAVLPNLQTVPLIPDRPTVNVGLVQPDGKTCNQFQGNVYQRQRLATRPQAPTGPFTLSNLLSHFQYYNQMVCDGWPGPIPNHEDIPWSVVYSNMLNYFLAGNSSRGGNAVDVSDLWVKNIFADYGCGHAKFSGTPLTTLTILVDNTHQNVWVGVYNLTERLASTEARSAAEVHLPDGDPSDVQYIIDDFLLPSYRWAGLKQAANYASQLANLEMVSYTIVLPEADLAMVAPSLAEGDPLAIAQVLLHLPKLKGKFVEFRTSPTGPSRYKFTTFDKSVLTPVEEYKGIATAEGLITSVGKRNYTELRRACMLELESRYNLGKFHMAGEEDVTEEEVVLYFGYASDNVHNGAYAADYAAKNGKKVITDTDGGKFIANQVEKLLSEGQFTTQELKKLENDMWAVGSRYFMADAQGPVTAFVTESLKDLEGKVFMITELPIVIDRGLPLIMGPVK
jgi:hypothetical protein